MVRSPKYRDSVHHGRDSRGAPVRIAKTSERQAEERTGSTNRTSARVIQRPNTRFRVRVIDPWHEADRRFELLEWRLDGHEDTAKPTSNSQRSGLLKAGILSSGQNQASLR